MKRPIALVIGLAMMAATPGVATADPVTRPPGHQQAVDALIARALTQRGVPYTYGGGDASGPTRRPASVPVPTPDVATPLNQATTGLGLNPVPSANPYWDRVGVTITDPDGFRVVPVAAGWPDPLTAPAGRSPAR